VNRAVWVVWAVWLMGVLLAMTAAGDVSAQAPHANGDHDSARAPPVALALEAAQAAIAACAANGYVVAATVIDASGELKVVIAADEVPAGDAVAHSFSKAVTALTYRMSSAAVQARTQADPKFAAEVEANPKLRARAGGEILASHGEIIGAIAVSGAPGGDKDDLCTLAGVAKIKDRL